MKYPSALAKAEVTIIATSIAHVDPPKLIADMV
jgi:hypothetical protein